MLERLVSDWLANVTERQFEIPFAQLLALRGYRVIHHARPHGPMEQGKDIIAIDRDGNAHAYQLKQGDLTLKDWRAGEIKSQIEDLLDLQIQHPSIVPGTKHRSHLVTTGLLDDTLRQTIDQFNRTREAAGKSPINVITGGDLRSFILESYESFIPTSASMFRDFLILMTLDPEGPTPTGQIYDFFWSTVHQILGDEPAKSNTVRFQHHIWLLAAHVSYPFERAGNWIGAIEAWITAVAAVMRAKTQFKSLKKNHPYLDSALIKISGLMRAFLSEIKSRDDLHADRFGIEDSFLVGARITQCLGWAAASTLFLRSRNEIDDFDAHEINPLFEKWVESMEYWGESADPFYLAAFWFQQNYLSNPPSQRILFRLLNAKITIQKRVMQKGSKIDGNSFDPYCPPEEAILNQLGLLDKAPFQEESNDRTIFHSYYLEGIVLLLVKRLWRQSLTRLWSNLSDVPMIKYILGSEEEYWTWRSKNGREVTWNWQRPSSWSKLLGHVKTLKERESFDISELGAFHLIYLLVFPHRVTGDLLLQLDDLNRNKWANH